MGKAGLKDIRVEKMTHELEFHSPEHMWDWVTNSNPIGADLVADLSQEEVYGSRQALDEMLSERTGESGNAILTNRVHIGMGTK